MAAGQGQELTSLCLVAYIREKNITCFFVYKLSENFMKYISAKYVKICHAAGMVLYVSEYIHEW